MKLDFQTLLPLAESFPEFVRFYGEQLRGWEVPDLHMRMAETLVAGDEYVGLAAFRNSAKTTIAELFCCYRLWLNPALYIVVIAGEQRLAKRFSRAVHGHMQRIPMLAPFTPKRVGANGFRLLGIPPQREDSVTVLTPTGNLRGYRSQLTICDDVISSKIKNSPTQIAKVNESIGTDIPEQLDPSGMEFVNRGLEVPTYCNTKVVALFTPTDRRPNDAYQKTDDSENFWNGFKFHYFPLIRDAEYDKEGLLVDGDLEWENRSNEGDWSLDYFKEQQHANPLKFSIEKQVDNNPIEDKKSLIRFSKIPQREEKIKSPVCFVDPSGGSDGYAYAIGGLVHSERGTTVHLKRVGEWRNLTPDESAVELLDVLLEEDIKRVHVEENFPVAAGLRQLASSRNQALVVETFKTTKNKTMRLKEKLPTSLNSGAVSFDPSVLGNDAFVRQLRSLRAGPGLPQSDDMLDAIEFLIDHYEGRINVRRTDKPKRPKRVQFA